MTPDQIEVIAQRFHAAECAGEWCDEPEASKERFREVARIAIANLNHQLAAIRSASTLSGLVNADRIQRSEQPTF
jgi:hypothetical protein